ncbi:MAG: DUF2569 domain-containing protein [Lentisphaerota bacterium]
MENSTVNPPPENDPEKVFRQVAAEILKDAPPAVSAGIGGWLLLPSIGLGVMSCVRIDGITKMLLSFSPGNWKALTDPASPGYHWAWGPVMVSGLVIEVILLVLGIVLLVLLFRRKKFFPKLIIAYYLLDVVSVVGCTFAVAVISMKQFQFSELFSPENCRQVLNGSIWAFIWIPYFIMSKRVKNTFVND